jgi:hypothetical protein
MCLRVTTKNGNGNNADDMLGIADPTSIYMKSLSHQIQGNTNAQIENPNK